MPVVVMYGLCVFIFMVVLLPYLLLRLWCCVGCGGGVCGLAWHDDVAVWLATMCLCVGVDMW